MNQSPRIKAAIKDMNRLGKARTPFLFLLDFDLREPLIVPLTDVSSAEISYDWNGRSNLAAEYLWPDEPIGMEAFPMPIDRYAHAFDRVIKEIKAGNSYLLNLTFPTPIKLSVGLADVFHYTKAKYKLCWKDRFVFFSPEIFVQIKNGKIHSYPMKGTISADLPGAADKLLQSPKETAEHATIVDLIRNDLGRVATKVNVERYRYLDHLMTMQGDLLQTSSHISGQLGSNYHEQLGDIVFRLLPAGSITGAPKCKTVEIIREVEGYARGFYTGIAGLFDGEQLDSAVMIRFIEQTPHGLVFKSGGGITAFSQMEEEYREMLRKVDLPLPAARVMEVMG